MVTMVGRHGSYIGPEPRVCPKPPWPGHPVVVNESENLT